MGPTFSPRRPHGRRGFTLVEILIVLVVLAIMLAAGAPAVARKISNSRVQNSARVVAGDIEEAFSLASRQRRPVRIAVETDSMRVRIIDRATGTVIRTRRLGADQDLKVETIAATAASVDIFPSGVASGPITITLTTQGYSQRVTMTRVGRVRVTS